MLIGGLAAIVHGTGRSTSDVDVVYARDRANMERLCAALAPFSPYLRGAPPGLPFKFDVGTVRRGLNFTLVMEELGSVDFLGEVTGGGTYDQLVEFAEPQELFGCRLMCVSLDHLILLKRAAGRPKDLEVIAELEALRNERAAGG